MSNETKAYASEYMTTEEVAALYHVCKKTVQRWRVAGKLKGVKVCLLYTSPSPRDS